MSHAQSGGTATGRTISFPVMRVIDGRLNDSVSSSLLPSARPSRQKQRPNASTEYSNGVLGELITISIIERFDSHSTRGHSKFASTSSPSIMRKAATSAAADYSDDDSNLNDDENNSKVDEKENFEIVLNDNELGYLKFSSNLIICLELPKDDPSDSEVVLHTPGRSPLRLAVCDDNQPSAFARQEFLWVFLTVYSNVHVDSPLLPNNVDISKLERLASTEHFASKHGIRGSIGRSRRSETDKQLERFILSEGESGSLNKVIDRLLDDLERNQCKNIEQLLTADVEIRRMILQLNMAERELDSMYDALESFSMPSEFGEIDRMPLETARRDIESIRQASNVVSVQNENDKRLLATLDSIFKELELSESQKELLESFPLAQSTLNELKEAVEKLERGLRLDLPGGVLYTVAVSSRLLDLEALGRRAITLAQHHFEDMFFDLALEQKKRQPSYINNLNLNHSSVHKALEVYVLLMRAVKGLEEALTYRIKVRDMESKRRVAANKNPDQNKSSPMKEDDEVLRQSTLSLLHTGDSIVLRLARAYMRTFQEPYHLLFRTIFHEIYSFVIQTRRFTRLMDFGPERVGIGCETEPVYDADGTRLFAFDDAFRLLLEIFAEQALLEQKFLEKFLVVDPTSKESIDILADVLGSRPVVSTTSYQSIVGSLTHSLLSWKDVLLGAPKHYPYLGGGVYYGISDLFVAFAEDAYNHDPFYVIPLLGETTVLRDMYGAGSLFLIGFVTHVEGPVQELLNRFVEEESATIMSLTADYEDGVFEPFTKFPYFLDHTKCTLQMMITKHARVGVTLTEQYIFQLADSVALKLSSVLFKWCHQLTKRRKKYRDISMFLNLHYYLETVTARDLTTALTVFLHKAKALSQYHLEQYCEWILTEFSKVPFEFLRDIESRRTSMPDYEIQFHIKESRTRQIIEKYLSSHSVHLILQAMYRALCRHIPDVKSVIFVWDRLTSLFAVKYERAKVIIRACYGNDIIIQCGMLTSHTLSSWFDEIRDGGVIALKPLELLLDGVTPTCL